MMRMVMRMRRMMMVVFVVVIVLKKSVIARVYMRVTMCGIIAMEMRMLVHIFLYMIVILAVMAMRDFLHMRMRLRVLVMCMRMVVVVRMRMVMFVVIFLRMRMPTWHSAFLLTMNQHPHMRAGNAALCARLCFKNHARDSHGVQFGKRGFLIRHQFQESRGQHIARRPHRTFDI